VQAHEKAQLPKDGILGLGKVDAENSKLEALIRQLSGTGDIGPLMESVAECFIYIFKNRACAKALTCTFFFFFQKKTWDLGK
jgi:hypothetical protein